MRCFKILKIPGSIITFTGLEFFGVRTIIITSISNHGSRLTAHGHNCTQLTHYSIFHLFTFILVFALTFCTGITAFAITRDMKYVRRSYSNGSVIEATMTALNCNLLISSSKNWNQSWYYASANITISGKVTVSGDVNLILKDAAILTAAKGIYVPEGSSLTIYGQKKGTGKLIATGESGYAGIGGQNGAYGTTITIHGGNIEATGGGGGAGIGGQHAARTERVSGAALIKGVLITMPLQSASTEGISQQQEAKTLRAILA